MLNYTVQFLSDDGNSGYSVSVESTEKWAVSQRLADPVRAVGKFAPLEDGEKG